MAACEMRSQHPSELSNGLHHITVRTACYGSQPMIMEKGVEVPTRDGTIIYANVFRPEAPGGNPVIMSADVYGKDSIHAEFAARLSQTLGAYQVSDFTAWEAPDPGYWVPNGYVVIKLALRGASGSVAHIACMGPQEAEDYYDAIEWAGTQPWSNGNVATAGVSYLAMTQWKVAQLNPPHLKAIVPWEGVSDLYREFATHGGIPETSFFRYVMASLERRDLTPGSTVEDVEALLEKHPLYDEVWQERRGELSKITVPMYVGASFSCQGSHTRGTIQAWREATSDQKWIEIHGRKEWEAYYGREATERVRRFLDHFLKGVANGFEHTPPVRIEVRERFYDGLVRYEHEWPITRTRYVHLYLDAAGATMRHDPVGAEEEVSYDSLAEGVSAGGATFTHVFDTDTELTGYMKLKLWVSTNAGDDLDVFVGVHKLGPDGHELFFPDFNNVDTGRVATGWLRVSHRELDTERSSPYQPWLKHARLLKVRPGEVVPVEIEILPSSTLFRGGEAIEVEVRGTEIPLDPGMGPPPEKWAPRYSHRESVNKGRHTIYTGGRYDSHLLVPVVPA